MKLPHGTPVKSDDLPRDLTAINATLMKNAFTGYLRASLINKPGESAEGVIVYSAGKLVIAFNSDGKTDRQDADLQLIASIVSKNEAILELCAFSENQLRLMVDFCKEFALKAPQPQPARAAKTEMMPTSRPVLRRDAPQEAAPQRRAKAEVSARSGSLPEVRGQFLKSESPESLSAYLSARTGETGHLIYAVKSGSTYAEYHILLIKGKAEAAYSETAVLVGRQLLDSIMASAGDAELYRVDESIIHSILQKYPWVATAYAPQPSSEPAARAELKPEPAPKLEQPKRGVPAPIMRSEPPRPASIQGISDPDTSKVTPPENGSRRGIGIPTRALLEKADRQAYSMEGLGMPVPEVKTTSTMKGDMDADIDYVKKVESEFVGNVDELLKRLELTHLKVMSEKKKR